jgi:hypothetical protein
LEDTFPAHDKAAGSNAKGAKTGSAATEPKLNIGNTIIKTVLDQSIGAAVNTLLFSVLMSSLQAAMTRPASQSAPHQSISFLLSTHAIDYTKVDLQGIVAKSRKEFAPIIAAGWKLWPFVSVVNFALIKDVQMRNLIGGLAGVVWGIYMSLVAAQ